MILSSHEEVLSTPLDSHPTRSGLTLVEMLVATTLTLILFLAVTELFSQLGAVMQDGRAIIELSGELRSVSHTLQQDLDFRTAEVLPWVQPGSNKGYFEIIEGPDQDRDYLDDTVNGTINAPSVDESRGITFGGDADDVLAFTAYSKNEPFVGLIRGELISYNSGDSDKYKFYIDRTNLDIFTPITSHYAEIIYFCRLTENDDQNSIDHAATAISSFEYQRDVNETVTLYRRVRLIRPDIDLTEYDNGTAIVRHTPQITFEELKRYYDLSIHPDVNRTDSSAGAPVPIGKIRGWATNSLEDLQLHRNRYGHFTVNAGQNERVPDLDRESFPPRQTYIQTLEQLTSGSSILDRSGEDVVLSKVLAFDVRVFDPEAEIKQPSGSGTKYAILPTDLGYDSGVVATNSDSVVGAYVDLGLSPTTPSTDFRIAPNSKSEWDILTVDTFNTFPIPTPPPTVTGTYPEVPTLRYNIGGLYKIYDTWPFEYEMDGLDQDGANGVDQGTNGFDDDVSGDPGFGIIDDTNELETMPPYPVPLRGISVQVRAYEPGTRQIRQDTIMADFLPE